MAVLLALGDAVGKTAVTFPGRGTSLRRVVDRLENRELRSVADYLKILKEETGYNLHVTLHRLVKRGLVRRSGEGYSLSGEGKKVVAGVVKRVAAVSSWDGKWRLVTFDIPEKRRKDRDWLRDLLMAYEFKLLHRSVFVGKFALPEEAFRELHERKLTAYVRLFTVGEMDEEAVA